MKKMKVTLPAVNDQAAGTSPYTRKAPYQFGWDWAPCLVTSGIWRPVKLEVWNEIKIIDMAVVQKGLDHKKAIIGLRLEVLADGKQKAALKISGNQGKVTQSENIELQSGVNHIHCDIVINEPELWWPAGYGKQTLYTICVEVSAGSARDLASRRVGLRSLAVRREDDEAGQSFTFVVNGIPVYIKGANWVPADSFPPRVSEQQYRELLMSAIRANMNMLRVWGGGIYEADIFYDICDELGILIWQDFMFACCMYPGDEDFLKSVREEAVYQVRRLRHHPCIALWCGNNEINQGWHEWGWKKRFPHHVWEDYVKLFHGVLQDVCKEEDPERNYWPTSPGSGTTPLGNSQDPTRGDVHYWDVWHKGKSFEAFKQQYPRFISEFGFLSFPEPGSVARFTISEDRNIESTVVIAHRRDPKANKLVKDYMEKSYSVPQDFDHFLLLSQILQAEIIKLATEHFRRIKPHCMGSLYWQLNDCWPVASWSSIDYYGRWKALHYYARRFYAPILISPNFKNGTYQFYVVSDMNYQVEAKLEIKLLDFYGTELARWERFIRVFPMESRVYFSLSRIDLPKELNPKESFLYCALKKEAELITDNTLYFVSPRKQKLPPPKWSVEIGEDNGEFLIKINPGTLLRNVILTTNGLDGHFDDNFFDLYPGQVRQIKFLPKSGISKETLENALSILTLYELIEY
jgi:beta-mannosidase